MTKSQKAKTSKRQFACAPKALQEHVNRGKNKRGMRMQLAASRDRLWNTSQNICNWLHTENLMN